MSLGVFRGNFRQSFMLGARNVFWQNVHVAKFFIMVDCFTLAGVQCISFN